MSRSAKPLRNSKRHPVELADIAFRELSLSGTFHSKADEERLWRIRRGLEYLDQDQANVRQEVASLLVAFGHSADVTALVVGLKRLAALTPELLAKHDATSDADKHRVEADALVLALSRPTDVRSPIERMIDEACGQPKESR